ncbi:hypothetical protein PNEG_03004 [Pneumocystis murina B123]|uniref:UspA domain-containing protein n=1 Tax=Pneumocystis murina (strain B123) TaxID=1069680 RepID=M7NMR6_PNEMU|nr:hypothetical protein PNEG_03004 [Pneumocystis murina B123]EMR08522.1 hypothetical protein PNEG_03004 [Pneumocystis murina B123]
MVFDAAKPIKKNKSFSSMELVLDEERKEILKFLETREMRLSTGLKNKCFLENNLEVGFRSDINLSNTLNVSSLPEGSRFLNESNSIFTKSSSIENVMQKSLDDVFLEKFDRNDVIESNSHDGECFDNYIRSASPYLNSTVNELESLSLSNGFEIQGKKNPVNPLKDSYHSSMLPSRVSKIITNKIHTSKNASKSKDSNIFSQTNMNFSLEQEIDADEDRRSQNMKIDMGTIIFTEDRTIRTIKRGEYPSSFSESRRIRSYLVSIDLSSESLYALEWAIGTIVRDYDIMMIVEAIDKDDKDDKGILELEKERLAAMEEICQITQKLLKKTKLILQIEIEIIHHKTPKHLLTEMIDYLEPTLVILGSRGCSSLKGFFFFFCICINCYLRVILGSFSNYIVNKSSVPVMVARKKPRKSKSKYAVFGTNIRMANNLFTKTIVD